jgi:hypothetical protein
MGNFLSMESGILSLLSIVIVYLSNKYLVPFLKVEKNKRYAEWIAHLADEITDDLIVRYPDNRWLKYLDESIDKLMLICGIDKTVAARAINSSLKRKESIAAN